MSKAPAKAEATEGEAPAKGGKKKMIIIIVAVLILAIAGGAAFMMMGKKKHAADGEEEEWKDQVGEGAAIPGRVGKRRVDVAP